MISSLALQAAVVYALALALGRVGAPAHRRSVLIAGPLAVAALPALGWVPAPLVEPLAPTAFLGVLEVVQEPSGAVGGGVPEVSTSWGWLEAWRVLWAAGLLVGVARLGVDLWAVWRL